ncbi:hypothetical protein ACH6YD_27255, partial [Klebsiella pneumoniae]|nr:hypothetical protein [Klebsiella pneumoniae]
LKMPAFEWVHVQLHQQKGMISLSPPTICNSAPESVLREPQREREAVREVARENLLQERLQQMERDMVRDLQKEKTLGGD